jgi:hypothetical protein
MAQSIDLAFTDESALEELMVLAWQPEQEVEHNE